MLLPDHSQGYRMKAHFDDDITTLGRIACVAVGAVLGFLCGYSFALLVALAWRHFA
jgi:hypothetical protein